MSKKTVFLACLSIVAITTQLTAAQVPPVPVAQAPGVPSEEVTKMVHTLALAWYGVVNITGMAVVVWVRWRLHLVVPRCLLIGAFGAICWATGLLTSFIWLTVLGVIFLCLAHVCECTFHFRRLLRQTLRERHQNRIAVASTMRDGEVDHGWPAQNLQSRDNASS